MLACFGCRSYAPAPIDWQHEAVAWSASATNTMPLTLEEARRCALILNPEINALRLSHQSSERAALAAGWWEDPEFDFDALRILRGGPHPWIIGAGLAFSLPLNGVPEIEKRAAQAYARADALAVTVAERELVAEVERLWSACRTDQLSAAVQHTYEERLLARESQINALIAAGELPKAEGDRIVQERVKLDLTCTCCGADAVERRQAFSKLLGMHPSVSVEFAETDEVAVTDRDALFGVLPASELDLARHPRVLEKLCRFEAGEEELRVEIRKQYPDLTLGPAFGHEEGGARMGVLLGLRLPLWNRNRAGIAGAEGERDAARFAAVSEWRSLTAEWHAARQLLEVAEAKEQRIREAQLAEAQSAAERTERLFNQGEADVLALLAAYETVYSVQEALLEAQQALSETRVRLDLLRIPNPSNNKQ